MVSHTRVTVADPDFELRRGPCFILLSQPPSLPSVISSLFNQNKSGWGPGPLPYIRNLVINKQWCKALRSISLASLFVTFYFWLIWSFTDPAFTGSIFVKKLAFEKCFKVIKIFLNSVYKVTCFEIRSTRVNSCLSGRVCVSGFLYKILSTSVKHKEENRDSLQHLTQNPTVTFKP